MFASIMSGLKVFFKWLLSVYSESDGTGSSTRVHIGLLVMFVLGTGVSFAVSVHHKLITIEQFDSFLTSSATFLASVGGVLYGANKLSEWGNNKNQNQNNNNQTPS